MAARDALVSPAVNALLTRAAAGALAAVVVAFVAYRARSLSRGGAVAAIVAGTAAVAAGWSWGVLLVLYFAASSLLTRVGADVKAARSAGILAKGDVRDAVQVTANGGPFIAAAIGWVIHPDPLWMAFGAGALAASAADTWATEVGLLAGRTPRSILNLRPVASGTSGGVTLPGLLAALAGAAFIAVAALALGWPPGVAAVTVIAGIFGATIDSVFGATIQARRWCDACDMVTERYMHVCGTATHEAGGVRWLGNDAVNFLSGTAGGLLALLLAA